jgi:hypothetical protein
MEELKYLILPRHKNLKSPLKPKRSIKMIEYSIKFRNTLFIHEAILELFFSNEIKIYVFMNIYEVKMFLKTYYPDCKNKKN